MLFFVIFLVAGALLIYLLFAPVLAFTLSFLSCLRFCGRLLADATVSMIEATLRGVMRLASLILALSVGGAYADEKIIILACEGLSHSLNERPADYPFHNNRS